MAGINIVGVQFRRAGKIYDFHARHFLLSRGDTVVVDTERGPSLAEVMRIGFQERGDEASLKSVIRVATRKDLEPSERLSEEKVLSFAKEKIGQLKLEMVLIGAEVQLGGSKVIVFFTANGRVDFRELVKELASGLKTRVELKQVGARDEAKQVGGLGICGREFCCSSFLREFVPVSIKMAKNQNLALNPAKVSGGCGRLLCCLTYEDDVYKELRKKLPPKKTKVRVEDGQVAEVIKGDILNQRVLVSLETGEQMSFPLDQIEILGKKKLEELESEQESDDWGADLDLASLVDQEPAKESRPKASERPQEGERGPKKKRPRRKRRKPKGPKPGGGE